ncbi:MAG: hypothetical protein INR70_08825 [Parafilimonas terrae]|nr:hypothetical protein [Parafilimonas terrae]
MKTPKPPRRILKNRPDLPRVAIVGDNPFDDPINEDPDEVRAELDRIVQAGMVRRAEIILGSIPIGGEAHEKSPPRPAEREGPESCNPGEV